MVLIHGPNTVKNANQQSRKASIEMKIKQNQEVR